MPQGICSVLASLFTQSKRMILSVAVVEVPVV